MGKTVTRSWCLQTQFRVLFSLSRSVHYNCSSSEEKSSAFSHGLQEILNSGATEQMFCEKYIFIRRWCRDFNFLLCLRISGFTK